MFTHCRQNVLASCIPKPALCFSSWLPLLPLLASSVTEPSAGMNDLRPWFPPKTRVLPVQSFKILNHSSTTTTGPARYLSSKRPHALHQDSGLCNKSFVSCFNPSGATFSHTPAPGLALFWPSLWTLSSPSPCPKPVIWSSLSLATPSPPPHSHP